MKQGKTPLFIVTGASGVGKSTVVPFLRKNPDIQLFDIDSIYGEVTDWREIKNIWVIVASELAQNNTMTVLCGTVMPWNIEKNIHFQTFSQVYYINFHCDDKLREND